MKSRKGIKGITSALDRSECSQRLAWTFCRTESSLLGFEPWIVQPLAQSVCQLYPSSWERRERIKGTCLRALVYNHRRHMEKWQQANLILVLALPFSLKVV